MHTLRPISHVLRAVHTLTVLAALAALGRPASAIAASPAAIVQDCYDNGRLDGNYSKRDLNRAVDNLPSDIDEYSNCGQIITNAASGSDRGGGRGGDAESGPGGSAGTANTPTEQAARNDDAGALDAIVDANDKPSVNIGGQEVKPGEGGLFSLASAANGMPLPLLLTLIAIGLLAALASGWALRRRFPAFARLSFGAKRPSLPRVGIPARLRRR
jgi:hypothetical protein